MYKVGHHDEMWERGQTTTADCNSHVIEPRMKVGAGLLRNACLAQWGRDESLLLSRHYRTGSGDLVAILWCMLSVQHDGLPELVGGGGTAHCNKMLLCVVRVCVCTS